MRISCPTCELPIDLSVCIEDGRAYLDIDRQRCDCTLDDQELLRLMDRARQIAFERHLNAQLSGSKEGELWA